VRSLFALSICADLLLVYTKTTIISQAVIDRLESKGVKFSLKEDCAAAMLRIATDKSINGHSLAIVPRDDHPQGYIDAELDDEEDGTYWDKLQKVTLAASIRSTVREVTIQFEYADHCAGPSRQAVTRCFQNCRKGWISRQNASPVLSWVP
jgi:arabinogalactan endo-1,4-beta-galactosidase